MLTTPHCVAAVSVSDTRLRVSGNVLDLVRANKLELVTERENALAGIRRDRDLARFIMFKLFLIGIKVSGKELNAGEWEDENEGTTGKIYYNADEDMWYPIEPPKEVEEDSDDDADGSALNAGTELGSLGTGFLDDLGLGDQDDGALFDDLGLGVADPTEAAPPEPGTPPCSPPPPTTSANGVLLAGCRTPQSPVGTPGEPGSPIHTPPGTPGTPKTPTGRFLRTPESSV